ncbi:MAG: LytR/AlgR family response regulator transcription factor [Candidatus Cryptobacteroides sp.]
MLRCVIVDDEPLAVKLLENYVEKTDFLSLAGSWNDPVEALKFISENKPELAFFDIQMPDLDGLELAGMIPSETRVVFASAFKEYAFDSYGVDALDFLLKPVRYQKFLEAALKAREWFELKNAANKNISGDEGIFIKAEGEFIKLNLNDILYLEGMKDYVRVYAESMKQPLVTHLTMKAAEELLPPERFMRVHRSYIVNLSRIESVSSDGDISIGNAFIPVSDAYSKSLNAFISRTLLSK